jgi:hypothetical protein
MLPICFPKWTMKLTKASIDRIKLSPDRSELIVFDEALPGVGLRIRSGGKRTWIAQYGSNEWRSVATSKEANRIAVEARRTHAAGLSRRRLKIKNPMGKNALPQRGKRTPETSSFQ